MAPADTSSDVARRAREKFKADISKIVIKTMEPFKKAKKFESHEQFKRLARKVTINSQLSVNYDRFAEDNKLGRIRR